MNTSDNFNCGLNTELSIYVEKLDWGSRRQTRRRTVELLAAVSLYFGGLRKEIRPRSWIHVKVSTIARPRPLFQPFNQMYSSAGSSNSPSSASTLQVGSLLSLERN